MLASLLGALAARSRRVPRQGLNQLTPKISPKKYYKGKGVRSVGKITSKGRYKVDPEKVPRYIVPDLTGFTLKPYISSELPPSPPS